MQKIEKLRSMREQTFIMLFQYDFHEKHEIAEQNEEYLLSWTDFDEETRETLTKRVQKIYEKLGEIDAMLSVAASGWRLGRMGKCDLNILRLAVYEIIYDENIPGKVAVNEAVELAKKYGGDSSPAFVNGVLAKVLKKEQASENE